MSLDEEELACGRRAVFRRHGERGVGGEQALCVAYHEPCAVGGIIYSHSVGEGLVFCAVRRHALAGQRAALIEISVIIR